MNIRVIKESVNGARRKALSDLGSKMAFTEPLIVVMTPKKKMLTIAGKHAFSDYINESAIPANTELIRVKSRINTGVLFLDKNTIMVRVFGSPLQLRSCMHHFEGILKDVLVEYKVRVEQSTHRPNANDLVFIKNGKEKKFCGTVTDFKNNYFTFFITLKFNKAESNGLYKMNSPKMKLRGSFKEVSDIVGGLHDVNPLINESIIDEIIAQLAIKLKGELVEGVFTVNENLLLEA